MSLLIASMIQSRYRHANGYGGFVASECRIVFGEPRHIHPVPAPLFSVVGRIQQTVDQQGVRVRPLIGGECLHFLVGWLESRQVHINAADERSAFGGRGWLYA